jgi:hypothetical protein
VRLLTYEGYAVAGIHANTMHRQAIEAASRRRYDVVLIDAGHSYDEVISDAMNYGPLADKYVVFHDVMIPEVNTAFEEYARGKNARKLINSESFGYGVITL